jgi:hypothetical protein
MSETTWQVTSTKPGERTLVIAELPSGWHATEFATRWMTTRAAQGKVITIREVPIDGSATA